MAIKMVMLFEILLCHMGHINQKWTIDNLSYLFYYTAYIINLFFIENTLLSF